jgi:hypothetical protein
MRAADFSSAGAEAAAGWMGFHPHEISKWDI